jgi:putative endonuclease
MQARDAVPHSLSDAESAVELTSIVGWCVYMLRCADGTLYTGCTSALSRRLLAHSRGSAKYTRSRLPVELVYSEPVSDRSAALRREAALKKLSRPQKLALCGMT